MGMLCCRHTPIEFVKIEMNCYSGLCFAINDLPQPATCQLRSNWSSLRLTRCLKAVYPLFYQPPLECKSNRLLIFEYVHMQLFLSEISLVSR